jgi:hypothetical protein
MYATEKKQATRRLESMDVEAAALDLHFPSTGE